MIPPSARVDDYLQASGWTTIPKRPGGRPAWHSWADYYLGSILGDIQTEGRPDTHGATRAWAFSLRHSLISMACYGGWAWAEVGPRPQVPTMPPFSYRGGEPNRPRWEKSKIDRRIMGNGLILMYREFYNFYATVLDIIRPPGLVKNDYKRRE